MSAAAFRLARPAPKPVRIPLTPLIDVMLILLVFFMVTSTYLDLDMIPMAREEENEPAVAEPTAAPPPAESPGGPSALLVRVAADGSTRLRGAALGPEALTAAIVAAGRPAVLVLPSPAAPVQALVDVLGAAERAGAAAMQVVRLRAAASPDRR